MPGYILHLTAAQMLLDMLPAYPDLTNKFTSANDFLIGNLLPDTTSVKAASHFRNPIYRNKMMEYPDLAAFLDKYRHLLHDASCLGYYFHLYIDRAFFKDYIPQVATFFDAAGNITDIKKEVAMIYLKKQDCRVPLTDYLSENYYYGDYTKMNTYLTERYHIPLHLDTNVINPGIEEVNYSDVKNVLAELHSYLSVPASAVNDVTVFDVETLLKFLHEKTEEFLSDILPSSLSCFV